MSHRYPARRIGFVLIALLLAAPAPARAFTPPAALYLPLVNKRYMAPPTARNDALAFVNYYRALAGVEAVTFDAAYSSVCLEAAQYIAQSGVMSHSDQSAPGYGCASKGDLWMGSGTGWTPADTVESWLSSVGHRLWLLYPTTPTFGYGFYADNTASRAGAALDVLSAFTDDGASYPGWPLRYPASHQTGIPATRYPITLAWRYFGATPALGATSLTTGGGTPLAHTADTALPAGHRGIEVLPSANLPASTPITVSISGTYAGAAFSYTWSFTTGP